MDGFFFILSEDGRLLFVSENIEKFIGYSQVIIAQFFIFLIPLHLQIEMMGFPIFNFTHPADQSKIRTSLQRIETTADNPELSASPCSSTPHPPAPCSSTPHSPAPHQPSPPERGARQSFYIRLREKPLAKQDRPQYEHMHVVGHLRRQVDTVEHHTFIGVMRPVRDR